MRRSHWLLLTALFLVGCAAGFSSSAADCERIAGVREGLCPIPVEERPDAPVEVMPTVGGDGEELSLAEFHGRVVVVNFWASWCGPCRTEQPDLNEAYEHLPDDEVAFLAVNIEDTESNALSHMREFEMPYASLYDPGNAYASQWRGVGPRTIPTTVFVDPDGRVAARVLGLIGYGETVGLADAIASEARDG